MWNSGRLIVYATFLLLSVVACNEKTTDAPNTPTGLPPKINAPQATKVTKPADVQAPANLTPVVKRGWLGIGAQLDRVTKLRCGESLGTTEDTVSEKTAQLTGFKSGPYTTFRCQDRGGGIAKWEMYMGEGDDAAKLSAISVSGPMFNVLDTAAWYFKPFLSAKARTRYDQLARGYVARCMSKNRGQPDIDNWRIEDVSVSIAQGFAGEFAGQWFLLLQRFVGTVGQDHGASAAHGPSAPVIAPAATDEPSTAEEAVARIENEATPPIQALEVAKKAFARFGKVGRRAVAVATNTRGYRLFNAKKFDEALPFFQLATSMDGTYGMPRFNSARIYAIKGDIENCVKYLLEIKRMGRGQRDRLNQARKDEGFKKVWDEPRFKAVFE